MTIQTDIQTLSPGALVELYVLDMSIVGGGIARFHAGLATGDQPIVFGGNTYSPWPIKAEGFEYNGKGQAPRPTMTIANVDMSITILNFSYQDLVGCKLTRIRTLAKYLDGQPTADPNAKLPDDIYYIERKARDSDGTIEYELAGIWDVDGIRLPRRQIIANLCPWQYRRWNTQTSSFDYSMAGECGYTGINYFNANDVQVASASQDVCGKRLESCKKRFGVNDPLPFGAFPAAGKIRG